MHFDRMSRFTRHPGETGAASLPERRMQFVLSLRAAGVTDPTVLRAMEATPRDAFVAGVFRERAWDDTALPIDCGQTISQPAVVGLMSQALKPDRRLKVLEIGTGSGYQAAILSRLFRRVYSVERFRTLARAARDILAAQGLTNVTVITGDGTLGLPEQAPFDRIIITAAAEDVPPGLVSQLRVGGVMVLPVGSSDHIQRLIAVTRTETGLDHHEICDVRFVPLLPGIAEGH
jgi:protein-L-isoaspartate(D-aspartate) O-methyltransferase